LSFKIIGEITDVETIAVGNKIREIERLRRVYGRGRWRKLKGAVQVQLGNGRIRLAEVHWLRSTWYWQKGNEAEAVSGLEA
jgi:hypothetical protein